MTTDPLTALRQGGGMPSFHMPSPTSSDSSPPLPPPTVSAEDDVVLNDRPTLSRRTSNPIGTMLPSPSFHKLAPDAAPFRPSRSMFQDTPDLSFSPTSLPSPEASFTTPNNTKGSPFGSSMLARSLSFNEGTFAEDAFYSKSNVAVPAKARPRFFSSSPSSSPGNFSSPLSRVHARAKTISTHSTAVAPYGPTSSSSSPVASPSLATNGFPSTNGKLMPSVQIQTDQDLRSTVIGLSGRIEVLERTVGQLQRELASTKLSVVVNSHRHTGSSTASNKPATAGKTGFGGVKDSRFAGGLVPGVDFVDYSAPAANNTIDSLLGLNGARTSALQQSPRPGAPFRFPESVTPNYRSLLSSDMPLDYSQFVDKVVKQTDQQASVFLQHKIKQSVGLMTSGGGRDKYQEGEAVRAEITRLVTGHLIELMTNRFGNFLVSRTVEYATRQERLLFADKIRGKVVYLAYDASATHCLQNMVEYDVDSSPSPGGEEDGELVEEKARTGEMRRVIVEELASKWDSVTHRSAGHIWAKLLATGSKVSVESDDGMVEALGRMLRGRWAETARDEIGSLIVQGVLESWTDDQKQPVVDELLADIRTCAVQQWGNFVVLYLIEHSSAKTRAKILARLFEPVLACDLSTDNYGAKAVEKAIKSVDVGGREVVNFVRSICDHSNNRPRPLIVDVACHTAGAQVLTLLFTSVDHKLKMPMIQCVRRHGVTLKSTKPGSKIWYLVERTRAYVGH